MAGRHRYEPEVHRATWKPAEEAAFEPLRTEALDTSLAVVALPAAQPWWSTLFRRSKV